MGNPLPVNLSQECRKATEILNEFVDPVNGLDRVVPLSVLRKARGFAIFSVFRIGFIVSARAGSGIVLVKTEQGNWSAPAAIGIGGLGGGFNVGAEVTDFLVVLNSRSAVRSFMATGSLQLGGNLSLAVGPLGRSAEASGSVNSSGKLAAMFSYSRSKGLYGGVSLEGTVLIDREDANAKAYGRGGQTAKQILSGSVEVPSFASSLISTIEKFTLAHTPVGDLDHNPYDDEEFLAAGQSGVERERESNEGWERNEPTVPAGTSWNDRRQQYRNGAGRTQSSTMRDLDDDFGRFGVSDDRPPRKSSDSWTESDRRRRDDTESRNLGAYAFGSPGSSLTNAPPRTGSGASFHKRPGLRQRTSSIASNLSFGSLGRKKINRAGSTPLPDWEDPDDGRGRGAAAAFDPLDRELQSTSFGAKPPNATLHNAKSPSYGRSSTYSNSTSPSPFQRRHRADSSMSVTGRNGWSTFNAHADDDVDDFFGTTRPAPPSNASASKVSNPFADLAAGLDEKWTGSGSNAQHWQPKWEGGYSGSTMRGTSTLGATNVPQPLPSPALSYGSHGRSYSNQQQTRRTTPTISETVPTSGYGDLVGNGFDSPSNGAAADPPVLERVVALYAFEAQEEGDLGFERGQVIAVTKKTGTRDDWWQGRVEAGLSASKIGIFPASYTETL